MRGIDLLKRREHRADSAAWNADAFVTNTEAQQIALMTDVAGSRSGS
ncbi:MAG: hypothetical protein ACI8UD_001017 [Planctomycetota bacterium]|jgi:hypothetical protein